MLMPEEASEGFINALAGRHLSVAVRSNVRGRYVSVKEHPGVEVEFKLDHLGEIEVNLLVGGSRAEVLTFVQGGGEQMAQYVLDRVAGDRPSAERPQ
jgi:hypothetical protein